MSLCRTVATSPEKLAVFGTKESCQMQLASTGEVQGCNYAGRTDGSIGYDPQLVVWSG